MPLDATAMKKIAKLLPRLASEHDGEVVATSRAIMRSLNASGADLHDLVATLNKPAVERIVYREKVVYRDRAPAPVEEPEDQVDYRYIMSTAEKLLDPATAALNETEDQFIRQMRVGAQRYKARFRMSPKQESWFEIIADKYLGASRR